MSLKRSHLAHSLGSAISIKDGELTHWDALAQFVDALLTCPFIILPSKGDAITIIAYALPSMHHHIRMRVPAVHLGSTMRAGAPVPDWH